MTTSRSKKLLVVDDDPIDAQFVRRAFSKLDGPVEVLHASGYEEASDLIENYPVDFILLDINMPGTHGIDALIRLRQSEQAARLPIVMFSSSENSDDIEQSYRNNASAYVVKPATPSGYTVFAEAFKRFWIDMVSPPGPLPGSFMPFPRGSSPAADRQS